MSLMRFLTFGARQQISSSKELEDLTDKWYQVADNAFLLDEETQTLDFHRDALSQIVIKKLRDKSSDLSKSLLMLDNARELIADLVMVGLSDSLSKDGALQDFIARDGNVWDGTSAGEALLEDFSTLTAARTKELDDWMTQQYLDQENFRKEELDGFPQNTHRGTWLERFQRGQLMQNDIDTLQAYVNRRFIEPPGKRNVHAQIKQQVATNSANVDALDLRLANTAAKSPNGQSLAIVDEILGLLKADLILWQTPLRPQSPLNSEPRGIQQR
jgi:hypothetical protein